jgi:hypothetical protein
VEKFFTINKYGGQVNLLGTNKSYQPIPQELVQKKREGGFVRIFQRSQETYGSYVGPHHSGTDNIKREEEYLGKVIERENNIFYNHKWGVFEFTIQNGYKSVNNIYHINRLDGSQDFCSLRYGNIWLLNDLYTSTNIESVLSNILPFDSDTLHVLLAYKLTTGDNAFTNVDGWYQRSYARILYPNAAVSSSSISVYLQKLGENSIREKFFDYYHNYLKEDKQSDVLICNSVLIDSTGSQNSIKLPIIAVSNHNGVVNNEFRVIYVVDYDKNLPIYMDQVPGNVIDTSTLKYMVNLLQNRNIKVKCCVLDAGYYSTENLEFLDSIGMNYLIRMCNNRKLYKQLIENDSFDLDNNYKYRIKYKKRYLHCKKIVIENNNIKHYAYIVLDFDREKSDREALYNKYENDSDINDKVIYLGKFILYSNFDIEEKDVINFYYTRQQIEQMFDISKNNGSMLPLRSHSTEGTMGHLLLSFIATIISLQLNNKLKGTKFCASAALAIMKELSVHVSQGLCTVEPLMPFEKELAIILNLNLDIPVKVDLTKEYTNAYLNGLKASRSKGRPKGRKNRPFLHVKNVNQLNVTDSIGQLTVNNDVKRRGRPKGSKNSFDTNLHNDSDLLTAVKRKRGCPKGSKNKLKL